jgi:RimJ/RimL family protein N-acetyltransferase
VTVVNHLGQPLGDPVPHWTPRRRPSRDPMSGRFCTLEGIDVERHSVQLHAANVRDAKGAMWTYLAYGPFATLEDYRAWVRRNSEGDDPIFYAVIPRDSGQACGVASYLRIKPEAGSIEVGGIAYSPLLQRTGAATEAMYLMMRLAFDELGYRRYEWKCNALNAPSRAAAERLGFTFEGIFRQAQVVKGGNRDTAWYSILDTEWPALKAAFERWLDPANFDAQGRQRQKLADLR